MRELRNFVERSLVFADGRTLFGNPAELEALGTTGASSDAPAADQALDVEPTDIDQLPFNAARRLSNERFERQYLRALLARHDGVVTRAARQAQMDRAHLNQLLKRHGLK